MIRFAVNSLLAWLVCVSACQAQIALRVEKRQAITGVTTPQIVGGVILVGEGSKPVSSEIALIKVETKAKFVKVSARRSLFEFAELEKVNDTTWILSEPGKTLIEVTTFDPEKGIDEARQNIEIGAPQPPKPDEPKPDDPKPPSDFADIEATSRTSAGNVNDPETATRLGAALMAISKEIPAIESVATAQAKVVAEIERVLADRKGASTTKDWRNGWRLPMNVAIEQAKVAGKIPTTKQYALVVEAMSKGLGAK